MHSDRVVPQGLFLACAGARHGLDFLPQALRRGAVAVAWEPVEGVVAPTLPETVSGFPVTELRNKVGQLADAYYGPAIAEPVRKLHNGHQRKNHHCLACRTGHEYARQTRGQPSAPWAGGAHRSCGPAR